MSNNKKGKLAIVMSGGGLQCAYSAGALVALGEYYKVTEPNIIVAASGSAGTAAYYMTGQYEKIALAWIALSQEPDLVSIFRNPILDVNYVVDGWYKKRYPLNLKKLAQVKTKLLLPVIRIKTGKLIYLTVPHNKEIFTDLRAAMAAPFVYGKRVRVRGHYYMDGGFGPTVSGYINKAIKEGATKVIVITNAPQYSLLERTMLRVIVAPGNYLRQEKGFIKGAKKILRHPPILKIPKNVRILSITSSKKLPVTFLGGRKFDFRITFNMGYEDVLNHPHLKDFLK